MIEIFYFPYCVTFLKIVCDIHYMDKKYVDA